MHYKINMVVKNKHLHVGWGSFAGGQNDQPIYLSTCVFISSLAFINIGNKEN